VATNSPETSSLDYKVDGDRPSDVQRVTSKTNTLSYVEKTKYGMYDPDEADEDIQKQVENATPITKRRIA